MEKNPGMFSSFLFDRRKKDKDILDDMRVSKLSAKVFFFFKVNYSFKLHVPLCSSILRLNKG